jgi:hypothetical protein
VRAIPAWSALSVSRSFLLNWWKNGLQLKLRMRIYPDGLLIAAIYALACWATRQISVDQFYLGAGIRVSALLLCPPRLWPYLLLGEYAYFAQMRFPMIETHGTPWVIFGSVFLMPTAMFLAKVHRARIYRASDAWMLSLAVSVAASITLLNVVLSQLLWPVPPSLPALSRAVRYVLGDFIGILTVAPLALLWIRRHPDRYWAARRSVPTAACLSMMLVLGLGCAQLPPESTVERTTLQLLTSLPAIALTCILGWPGAALAVPLLNLTVGLTMPTSNLPWSFDSTTFTVQQILALASAALLALGSTISGYYHRCLANAFSRSKAAALVRTSHYAGEMDLRHRALEINRIGDSVDRYLSETASWLKAQGHEQIAGNLVRTSGMYSRKFREQASMVYPTALEHVGLYLTLQAGGISEAWSNTGCLVEPRLAGDPCRLTVPLQLAAYRAVTEAVSLLLQRESGHVRINARCGRSGGSDGILIVVAMLDTRHKLSDATRELALETLSGRAMAYGGAVHCRRNRIRMLFLDASCA